MSVSRDFALFRYKSVKIECCENYDGVPNHEAFVKFACRNNYRQLQCPLCFNVFQFFVSVLRHVLVKDVKSKLVYFCLCDLFQTSHVSNLKLFFYFTS